MKKLVYASLLLFMTAFCSCKFAGKITGADEGTKMDEKATYTAVVDALSKLDKKWKVLGVRIRNEGQPDECQNIFGRSWVELIDSENQRISQTILPETGTPDFINDRQGLTFDSVPTIEFSADEAMKNIAGCKELIPEGYKFLNLADYWKHYDKHDDGVVTYIKINVQEIGKEKVEANGTSQEVYYSLNFDIDPDGNIVCRELKE